MTDKSLGERGIQMGRGLQAVAIAGLLFPSLLWAQRAKNDEGFELGSVQVRPVVEALGAYDNRVAEVGADSFEGDLYSELAAALYLENKPAQYDFSAHAGYGYRSYREYTGLDNDFYRAGVAVASTDGPLNLGLASYLKKTLDYDTVHDTSGGQEPGAILTRDPSTRYTTTANITYEKNLTDKTSIAPGYDVWHYFQDLNSGTNAEWQVHRASLQVGYGFSEKTRMFLTGYYSLQTTDDEDGSIGGVTVGVEGRFSKKTGWRAHVGVAAADYEDSGTGQGVVGLLRGNWTITEKLSAYIYGSSNFQPGYRGVDARRTQRLGYGATWRVVSRWVVMGRVLHDYQEELDSLDGGEAKNFISVQTEYDLTRRFIVGAGMEYTMDEEETDQTVVALSAAYRY